MSLHTGYTPGRSLLHRMPAGAKLLSLFLLVSVVLILRDPWVVAGAAVLAAVLFAVARIRLRDAGALLRPLLPFLVLIAGFQAYTAGWEAALRVCAQIAVAVLLGGLLTRTTRVGDMLALFERLLAPIRFAGARPDRAALVLALTVRSIPLVGRSWQATREACAARGLRAAPHRMVVPVIVNLLRSAEAVGEAMSARGLE